MVKITNYARMQKRHRGIQQSCGLWERARVGWFGRMARKHVWYHMSNEPPVQVLCMIQDARDWCTGMTQQDGMGREVGGEFRTGNRWSSSRSSLFIICFLPLSGIIWISEVIDISPGNLESTLWFMQPRISQDVLCIKLISKVTITALIYSFPNFNH